MKTDALNNRHIHADEGKVFRRISDGWVAGSEIYLGYASQINGITLNEPLWELPEHYEEIDDPTLEEIVLLDEETELAEYEEITDESLSEPVIEPDPPKITLADYRKLEAKVAKMMAALGLDE